jgi:hypothetical protein
MSIITLEGIVDHGQIRLQSDLRLPDNTKVYIVVPDLQIEGTANIYSPRLANQEDASEFQLEVIEEPADGGI